MKTFRILFVDDDLVTIKTWSVLLQQDKDEFAKDQELEIITATNQEEADERIRAAPSNQFDLVLLDLIYPLNKDPSTEGYRGDAWLPELRQAQPSAAIVIVTSHAHEGGLKRAVDTLLGDADEFIPKDVQWSKIVERLKSALRRRRERMQLAASAHPLLSNVARTSSEDIHSTLSRTRARLQHVESHPTSTDAERMSEVNRVFDSMQSEIIAITSRLTGRIEKEPNQVECCELAKEQALLFEAQLGGRIDVECLGDCSALTYPEEVETAVREVLQNAVDAVAAADKPREGAIRISVGRPAPGNKVLIEIRDTGAGLQPAAKARLFEPGNSAWEQDHDRHKGMGLYVARRRLYSTGGDLEIGPADGGGTLGRLVVRDWGRT